MKPLLTVVMLYMTALFTGWGENTGIETMQLLDEQVTEIRISAFEAWDDMNVETFASFEEANDIRVFEDAIRNAHKQRDDAKRDDPDYDITVVYPQGLPLHGLKL